MSVPAIAQRAATPAYSDAAAHAPSDAAPSGGTDAPEQNGGMLGDIVVTAQKRATDLQKTPISISVLDAKALDDRHVLSLQDLGDGTVPGLRVEPFFSRSSALVINIRGVGNLSDPNQPAREQGVGVYLDGVYLGRSQGLGAALYDVERIEVLKGPQGTLFGRNTEGGAISIVSKKPSGEFHATTTLGAGNFGSVEGITHIDLPRVGNISFKIDAVVEKRDGTVSNPLAGQPDFNGYDRHGVHVAALWEPGDRFSALYQFDVSRDATTPYYLQLLSGGSLPRAPVLVLQPDRAKVGDVGVPMQDSVGDTSGVSLALDWKLGGGLTARSITAYRTLTQTQFDDGSAVLSVYAPNANFSRYSLANFYQHQFSQELHLLGDLPHLSFVGGLFYYSEHVSDNAYTPNTLKFNADGTGYTVLPAPVAATPFPDRASVADTDSAAVFGQATYTPALLGNRIHLTLGGRYSDDRKNGSLNQVNGALPVVNGVAGAIPLHVRSDRFDPLVTLAVDVAPGVNLYGKWSTGYKSGGANSRSLTYRPFGPESVSEFEVGAKTEFLDRRVRVNVAGYAGTYEDVQIDFNAVIPGANRGTLETTNTAGSGHIAGAEADVAIALAARLTLSGSYAHNYVRLPPAPNPFVAGSPLVAVYPIFDPRDSASGAIDYRLPIRRMAVTAHLDANYAASQYSTTTDPTKSDASIIVNGRLALGDIPLTGSRAMLTVSIWARNLLNEQNLFLRNYSAALGTYGIYNNPRTFGAEATIRF